MRTSLTDRIRSVMTPRALRALRFACCNLCIAAAVYTLAYRPIEERYITESDRLEQLRLTSAKYRDFLQLAAQMTVDPPKDRPATLFERAADGAVDAALSMVMKQKVEGARARLASIRSLPFSTVDGTRYAAAHVEFSGPVGCVQAVLRGLEENVPYLFVRETSIMSGDTASGGPAEPEIQVQMDVYGPVEGGG